MIVFPSKFTDHLKYLYTDPRPVDARLRTVDLKCCHLPKQTVSYPRTLNLNSLKVFQGAGLICVIRSSHPCSRPTSNERRGNPFCSVWELRRWHADFPISLVPGAYRIMFPAATLWRGATSLLHRHSLLSNCYHRFFCVAEMRKWPPKYVWYRGEE